MSKVREFVYKHFLISEIWGDDGICEMLGGVNWKFYYCSDCGGEYEVVKITRDEIEDKFKFRDAAVRCKSCGKETEMGFSFPIK